MSTSLGAFGPLFGSDYVYNATALDIALTALGVTFPNDQLARGQHTHKLPCPHFMLYLTLSDGVHCQSYRGLALTVHVQTAALMHQTHPEGMIYEQC